MMQSLSKLPLLLLSLLFAALTGCGDSLVGPEYPGEPLATLQGQMTLAPDTSLEGEVRLAFVWYPQILAADDTSSEEVRPLEILSEELAYEGSFPLKYSFPLYRPPPSAALRPLGALDNGLQLNGKGAFGTLVAYQDGNGNGRLDTIPADGEPVDKVLAASLMGDAQTTAVIIYLDSDQPAETQLSKGFNLSMTGSSGTLEVVPLTTSVPLVLTPGSPFLDGLVCEAGWLTFLVMPVCGLESPFEEPPVDPAPSAGLKVSASVGLSGSELWVDVEVRRDGVPVQGAQVTLAGRTIPYSADSGTYVLSEGATTLLAPGASATLAVTEEGEEVSRTLQVPGDFGITAPTSGATVKAGSQVEAQWMASAAAQGYEAVVLGMGGLPESVFLPAEQLGFTFTAGTAGTGGEALLRVTAWWESPWDENPVSVRVTLEREQAFTLVP